MKPINSNRSKKRKLADRAYLYGLAIQDQRRQAEHDARKNPTYAPSPIPDALATAYERGYRDALADLRREIKTKVPGPETGDELGAMAVFMRTVHAFLRPMR